MHAKLCNVLNMVNKYLMNVLLKLSGGNQAISFTKLSGHPAYYLIRNWDVNKRFSEDELSITAANNGP